MLYFLFSSEQYTLVSLPPYNEISKRQKNQSSGFYNDYHNYWPQRESQGHYRPTIIKNDNLTTYPKKTTVSSLLLNTRGVSMNYVFDITVENETHGNDSYVFVDGNF